MYHGSPGPWLQQLLYAEADETFLGICCLRTGNPECSLRSQVEVLADGSIALRASYLSNEQQEFSFLEALISVTTTAQMVALT